MNNSEGPFEFSQLDTKDKIICFRESIDYDRWYLPKFSMGTFCSAVCFGGRLRHGVFPAFFGDESDCLGSAFTYPSSVLNCVSSAYK
jgi:hypothetical protein